MLRVPCPSLTVVAALIPPPRPRAGACDELACSHPSVGAIFFVTFILIGFIMLLSVFVAVIFEVYKRQHAFVILAEKVAQRKALSAAFTLLDISADGERHARRSPRTSSR